jgi:tetratricopeptide (TPR) repeat protein
MEKYIPRNYLGVAAFVLGVLLMLGVIRLCGHQLNMLSFSGPTIANVSIGGLSNIDGVAGEVPGSISKKQPSKFSSMGRIESQLRSTVNQLLAQGDYEAALADAKAYYNVIELKKTQEAVRLVTTVLAKARGEKIAEAFRDSQLVAQAPNPETDDTGGESVLKTVRIDPSVYEQTIDDLRDESQNTGAQIACGNLLLLADRPIEARLCFELALQLVTKNDSEKAQGVQRVNEAARALEGIARAIRDEDDSAFRADEFVLMIRVRSSVQEIDSTTTPMEIPDPIREAAAKLTPSGIFKSDPRFASLQSPDDPYTEAVIDTAPVSSQSSDGSFTDEANDLRPSSLPSPEDPYIKAANDPSLAAWLREWQRTKVDVALLPDRRVELQQILNRTHLTCLTLIGIGRAISFQSTDEWTEVAFYAAAVQHANSELASYTVGAKDSRPIIDALYSVKSRLWKLVDGGDSTFVDALYTLNCDLIHWIPADDRNLQDARTHGFIGRAECLWAMGKIDDAVSAAESINDASLTADEKLSVAWIRGLALFSKGRFSDAITEFQPVADHPQFTYSQQAYPFLIVSLARSDRTDEANNLLDEWIRRYRPNSEQVASVMAHMGI